MVKDITKIYLIQKIKRYLPYYHIIVSFILSEILIKAHLSRDILHITSVLLVNFINIFKLLSNIGIIFKTIIS